MSSLQISGATIDNVELCIFDKDGTLIDIHHYWYAMLRYRAQYLAETHVSSEFQEIASRKMMDAMGIDLNTGRIKLEGPVGIKPRLFIAQTALTVLKNFNSSIRMEDVEEAFRWVDVFSAQRTEQIVKVLPGVREFLLELRAAGVMMAVATTDLSTRAELALKSIGLKDFFTVIIGADKVQNAKPSPEMVCLILEETGVCPQGVLVVGDADVDAQMARRAGVKFLGVGTGLCTSDFKKDAKYYVDTLENVHIIQE